MCFAPQWRALFRHFFYISTSKSGPRPPVFNTFDLEMCFAPQRRALFRHLNCATTACTFSTSQLPKVVRRWCVLYILTSKCASRHNGVQFFISHLASCLRTRRFSEPTFRASGAPNHWKNTVFRDFPTFSRICIFFLLTLSLLLFSLPIFLFSLPLPCSAFHLSILSEVWLLNFLRSFLSPLNPSTLALDSSSPASFRHLPLAPSVLFPSAQCCACVIRWSQVKLWWKSGNLNRPADWMSDLQNHVLQWLTFQASVRRSGHASWHNKHLLDVSQ